eukprot:scaffold45935_cov24-Tisochrysis_lutea.AAC.2
MRAEFMKSRRVMGGTAVSSHLGAAGSPARRRRKLKMPRASAQTSASTWFNRSHSARSAASAVMLPPMPT